jgi:acetolactate synthase small subunit
MALLAAFGARALSVSGDQVVIETAAAGAEIDALFGELERYGIEEAARTSPMALPRTSQENDKEVSA